MKKLLSALIGSTILFLTTYAPLSGPQPCEVRILLDANAKYDVDTTEIKRLLGENGLPCPYVLDITIWSQADLDRVLFELNRAGVGMYTIFPDGHHMIFVYVINDLYLEPSSMRDFSKVNSLVGRDWGNWIILHELGHMIWNGKGWDYSDTTELWCDNFANQNYNQYAIIVEERDD